MEIRIEKIVYPGRSLGLYERQVVFTDEGLPGELVRAEILAKRKTFSKQKPWRFLNRYLTESNLAALITGPALPIRL